MIAKVERVLEILKTKVQEKTLKYSDLDGNMDWALEFDDIYVKPAAIVFHPQVIHVHTAIASDVERIKWNDVDENVDALIDSMFEKAIQRYIEVMEDWAEEGAENARG